MANRLPVEVALVAAAEDLVDDFDALAVGGLTPDEIERFRRQLQAHLTQVDAHRHERSVLRSLERCGLTGEWARRELLRLWAGTTSGLPVLDEREARSAMPIATGSGG